MLKDKYNLWGGNYIIINNIYIDTRTIICYIWNTLKKYIKLNFLSGEVIVISVGSQEEALCILSLICDD